MGPPGQSLKGTPAAGAPGHVVIPVAQFEVRGAILGPDLRHADQSRASSEEVELQARGYRWRF